MAIAISELTGEAMAEKKRVQIYDTTLRDGTQAEGVWLSLEDKLMIAEKLDYLGVDYIEGGYPLSNPKDKAFFQEIGKRDLACAKVTAFGMTRHKGVCAEKDEGIGALLASGAPAVAIVGKSWMLHVKEVGEPPESTTIFFDHQMSSYLIVFVMSVTALAAT